MRCDQCKYWEVPTWSDHDGFQICTRIRHPEHIREEMEEKWKGRDISWDMQDKSIVSELRDAGAYVVDASDYSANLYTMADFGCVRFEQK